MPLSYNTPPPSAFRYLHIVVCTEPHRICDHVLSKPLAFQTFQNHFLRFPMANSCPSLDVNPDGPSHQLEPGTHQHCFSIPAYMSNQLSDRACPDLSLCPVLIAHLAAIPAPSIHNLGQDLLGREPTSSQAPLQITISHSRLMPSFTHPSDPVHQSEPTCLSPSH
jgi:hypothetical protein